jgi:hypothetical protein
MSKLLSILRWRPSNVKNTGVIVLERKPLVAVNRIPETRPMTIEQAWLHEHRN